MAQHVLPDRATPDGRSVVSLGRILVAVGAVVAAVCVGAGLWWQSQQVQAREYRDARAMAEVIGCQDTFVEQPSSAATSAGQCLVDGVAVQLRTFPDQRSAEAWHDGVVWASEVRPVAGIGPNYVVLTYDPVAAAAAFAALG